MVLTVAVASALQNQKGYLLMWPCEQTTGMPYWLLSHQRDKQLLGSLCWPSYMHLHSVWFSWEAGEDEQSARFRFGTSYKAVNESLFSLLGPFCQQ